MSAVPLLLYVAASAAYAVHFGRRSDLAGRCATLVLAAAALTHVFVIGMQTMESGHLPVVGTSGAISGFVVLLALAYLYTEMMTSERSMGVFIVPAMAVLQAIPTATNAVASRPPVLESQWLAVHVLSLLFAYASFALACVIGVTYVLLFKELKAKHLGFFYSRLPSLRVLDVMNGRAVTVGWLFLTIGLAVGVIWLAQVQPGAVDPARAGDVAVRSEDFRGAADLAGLHVRPVRPPVAGLERTPRGAAVGRRLHHRAAQLRADRLFRHAQPQLLLMNLFLLGASHHSAPIDLRERIDFTRRGVPEALG